MVKELADGLQELAMEKETLDDQEALSASPNGGSPIDTCENEVHETVKSLGDKLSAALLNISVKEELVKQHSKVAEEAVSGWEKAETEVATLKQQLEASAQNNSSLEDKISHLDRALKECVRQLRQSKEEHEQKVQDAITKKTQEWDSKKSELENQVIDLKTQFEASTTKFEDMDKENAAIKVKLVTLLEQLKIRTLENELSTQTAETASKQHLESIKKVAKLEAECRKLKALMKKTPSSSACVESLTDSLSDNVDRSCSDSWASALIAELDQFKNEKSRAKVINTSVDIDIMDDFLEMERLASMPEADLVRDTSLEVGDEDVKQEMVEFEEKVKKLESEKAELEINLEQVQKELELAIELKQAARVEVESVEAKRKESESQLEATMLEVEKLQDKLASLEGKVVLASELKTRLEASETTREAIQSRLHLAYTDVEKIRDKVGLLEGRIEEERALSAELTSKLETTEAQFLAASFEARNLQEKANLLEQRIEDENSLSLEFAAKVEAVEGKKNALESELALAHSEVQELTYKVALLEEELNSEKALSIKFAERCRNLEGELSRKRREAELRVAASSNGDLTLKQEKELTMSAEKLADCQKTIASLSRQLKSLITLDEINGGSPDFRSENAKLLNSIDPNRKDRGPTSWSTSSTSMLSGFGKLLPRSRSSSRIEN